jgi:hypothetical protein
MADDEGEGPARGRRPAHPLRGPERDRVRAPLLRLPAPRLRLEDHRLVRPARWRQRDIWAVRKTGETECFQCANHHALEFKKAEEDLAKLIAGPNALPTKFTLITGGKDTADMREKVVARAIAVGIREVEVWSGPEFEERLRRDEPLLIRRFVEGVPFPETVDGLRAMSVDGEVGDDEALALMAECFDRPAFTTEFRSESNIPDFKKAITDTIEALNTGVRRLRDGTEVGRISRKAQLKDPAKRAVVEEVVGLLVELRRVRCIRRPPAVRVRRPGMPRVPHPASRGVRHGRPAGAHPSRVRQGRAGHGAPAPELVAAVPKSSPRWTAWNLRPTDIEQGVVR